MNIKKQLKLIQILMYFGMAGFILYPLFILNIISIVLILKNKNILSKEASFIYKYQLTTLIISCVLFVISLLFLFVGDSFSFLSFVVAICGFFCCFYRVDKINKKIRELNV